MFSFKYHAENEAGRLFQTLFCCLKKVYMRQKQVAYFQKQVVKFQYIFIVVTFTYNKRNGMKL